MPSPTESTDRAPRTSSPKKNRRGHGEGSLFWEESSQRWVVLFDQGYVNAKRKRVKRRFGDWKQANQFLTDERNRKPTDQRLRLGDFLDYWLDEIIEPSDRKPSTKASYRDNVRLHIEPSLGHLRLVQIRYEAVQRFINRKALDGYSASTLRTLMVILRMALDHAALIKKLDPEAAIQVHQVKLPKAQRERKAVTAWTQQERQRFLVAARTTRLYALYVLVGLLGLRRGEALALRWSDLELDGDDPVLRVRRQVQRVRGTHGLLVTAPKSESAIRDLALPAQCVQVLREHRQRQDTERLALGATWLDLDLVFPNGRGGHIEPRNLNRHMAAVCKKAGLDRRGLHTLRHTAATSAHELGVDWKEIQHMLGHADLGTTMNVYVDMVPQLQRRAADLIDKGFVPGGEEEVGSQFGSRGALPAADETPRRKRRRNVGSQLGSQATPRAPRKPAVPKRK